jgi:ABC-2 type transport system ATP-binding protein
MICDRAAIVVAGTLRDIGPLGSLLSARVLSTEVVVRPPSAGALPLPSGATRHDTSDGVRVDLPEGGDVDAFVRAALSAGATLVSVSPRRESLEDLFVRQARGAAGGGA